MSTKIDLWSVVRNHLATLRSFRSGKASRRDYVFFFGLPAIFTTAVVSAGGEIGGHARGIIATALSIFAGLLFNLLLLVADIAVRSEDLSRSRSGRFQTKIKLTVLRELHSNIAFAILTSLATIAGIVALSIQGSLPGRRLLEGITLFLASVFFLTLLMILKRAHSLIASGLSEADKIAS